MLVAQLRTVWAPEVSGTDWSGPLVKLGGSLTAVTVMRKVCGSLASSPPLAMPPVSRNCTVTVALPLALAAGLKVSVPLGAMLGWTLNRALLSLVTRKVSVWPASSSAGVAGAPGYGRMFVAQPATL